MQIQYLGAFIGSIATEPINAVKVDAAVKQRQHPLWFIAANHTKR